jgi:pimeloyl-ACP methyl ester carboxylesterase
VVTALSCLVIILISLSCSEADDSDQPAALQTRADSVPSSDGVMIHYDVTGDGDIPLVLVHGWGADRSYWDDQRDALARDYRVITVDLAAHGESGMERVNYTVQAFGADVAAVMNELELMDAMLIGHSMGGAVILEAARQTPGRAVALIGVDTYQNLSQHPTDEQIEQYLATFRANFALTTEAYIRSLFPPTADTMLVQRVSRDIASAPEEPALSALDNLLHYDAIPALNDVQLPIRCINADRFPTDVEGNRMLAASFDVIYMPGHGHFLFLEDPGTFNGLLSETVTELNAQQTL